LALYDAPREGRLERQSEVPRLDTARLADRQRLALAADCDALASLELCAVARLGADGQFEVSLAARLVKVSDHLSDSMLWRLCAVSMICYRTSESACKAFSSMNRQKRAKKDVAINAFSSWSNRLKAPGLSRVFGIMVKIVFLYV
jgi:hypothetical protein